MVRRPAGADTQIINKIIQHRLSFLSKEDLEWHMSKVATIEENRVPGMIIECGVAKGGSALLFAASKRPDRCLHLFDTFEGIPPPDDRDGGRAFTEYNIMNDKPVGAGYGRCEPGMNRSRRPGICFVNDLLTFDQRMFHKLGFPPPLHNTFFHRGLFNHTLRPGGPIAYAHLDGDWYASIYPVLAVIAPFISLGGMIILDDAFFYSGAERAVRDYFGIDLKRMVRAKQKARAQSHMGTIISKGGQSWQPWLERRVGFTRVS